MTESGDRIIIFWKYCRQSKYKTGLFTKPCTYSINQQWATATSTVKL